MSTFKRILAATDFSAASSGAVKLACEVAAESGAELTILYVCEVPGYAADGPIPYDRMTATVGTAQAQLDDLVRSIRRACPAAKDLVKVGAPSDEILAVAAETHADLVVIGTHGRRGIAHALLGSVAERVIRLSPVPVLTVCARRGE